MAPYCIVCGKRQSIRHKISLHRFPKAAHVEGIGLKEADIVASSRVCSLHFHSGLHNPPSLSEDAPPRITRGQLQPLNATAQSTPVSELSEASPIFTDQNPPETASSCAEKQPLVGAEQVLDQHQDSESELEGYNISCLLSESSDMSLSRSATPSSARMSITPAAPILT